MVTIAQSSLFGTEFLYQLVDWIADHMTPDEIYSELQLKDWAEANGYQPIPEDY